MPQEFLTIRDEIYPLNDGILVLRRKGITRITAIEGLDTLTTLKELDLSKNDIEKIEGLEQLITLQKLDLHDNQIKEIKGFESLTNLEELDLSYNRIREIKGLENLKKLKKLDLTFNPIREDEWNLRCLSAQELVKYCENKRKMKKQLRTTF